MSLIKVAWYVFRVKNMHSGSSSDPWGQLDKAKQATYLHYVIRQVLKLISSGSKYVSRSFNVMFALVQLHFEVSFHILKPFGFSNIKRR